MPGAAYAHRKGRFRENVGRQYLLIYFLLIPVNLFQSLCPLAKLRIYYILNAYTGSPRYTDNNDDDMVDLDFFFVIFSYISVPSTDDDYGLPMFVYNIMYNVPPRYTVTDENHNAAGRNVYLYKYIYLTYYIIYSIFDHFYI